MDVRRPPKAQDNYQMMMRRNRRSPQEAEFIAEAVKRYPSVLEDELASAYKIPSTGGEIDEQNGFRKENKGSDGNCFFYVLLDQLERVGYNQRPKSVQEARQVTCDAIEKNKEFYKGFLSGLGNNYLEKTRQDGEYVDHPHIVAASRHYG